LIHSPVSTPEEAKIQTFLQAVIVIEEFSKELAATLAVWGSQ